MIDNAGQISGYFPNLRHLRMFEAVAQLQSVSRASEQVHLSQPAVTQAVAKLESHFNVPLFERRRSGSYLTKYGQILLLRTQRLFAQIEQALCDPYTGSPLTEPDLARSVTDKITLSQIRALLAIARSASFGQAARMAGIAPATLHRPARELEQLLKRPLYERTATGLSATAPCIELARRLRLAALEIDYALEELSAATGPVKARISIGALPLSSAFLLAAAVNDLLRRFPDAHVEIQENRYEQLLDGLRAGEIDILFGVLRRPDWARDVVEETLFFDPYAIAVRQGHPLTRLARVSVTDLTRYEWIIAKPGGLRGVAFERIFASAGGLPKVAIETSSLTVSRSLLMSSDRITLLTKQEVDVEQRMGMLTTIPFDSLIARRPDGIALRADWRPTFVQAEFLGLLRQHAMTIGGATLPAAAGKRGRERRAQSEVAETADATS